MRAAFPRSDYYEPSVPPAGHQQTACLPAASDGEGGQRVVPTFISRPLDGVGNPAMPLQHRPGYAADLPRDLPTDCKARLRSRGTGQARRGVRCDPAHIHQVRAGVLA